MTVKIGNIILDDNLRLYGLESADDIAISQYVAFDGSVDLLTMPAPNRRQLQLVATHEGNSVFGKFTLGQLQDIKVVASVGQPVTLTHHRGVFTVLILSVGEPVPVIDYSDPASDDWYTATINMIEV